MRLLIIRHGESEADLLDVHEGRADFALTAKGHQQAEAMARFVKERYVLSAIYASPLQRAVQTACHLSEIAGVTVTTDDRLMEFNNGLIAGMDRQEALKKYPPVKDLPVHAAVYEQESRLHFRCRAEEVLSEIISNTGEDETVAVVSHGGTINQLYSAYLRLPIDCGTVFLTGDTGIHEWLIRDGKRIIVGSNSLIHLSSEN